jgi:hypothetical protein
MEFFGVWALFWWASPIIFVIRWGAPTLHLLGFVPPDRVFP